MIQLDPHLCKELRCTDAEFLGYKEGIELRIELGLPEGEELGDSLGDWLGPPH